MLRILEIAWLLLAITGALFALYKLFTEGLSEALFPMIFTIISTVFFFIRRKQRIAMEKENESIRDASVKS
jgi:hypothetical protein